jgi:hypothetical protein
MGKLAFKKMIDYFLVVENQTMRQTLLASILNCINWLFVQFYLNTCMYVMEPFEKKVVILVAVTVFIYSINIMHVVMEGLAFKIVFSSILR